MIKTVEILMSLAFYATAMAYVAINETLALFSIILGSILLLDAVSR